MVSMRKYLFYIAVVIALMAPPSALALERAWNYRDWTTERISADKHRYSTHGEVVWGHTFGFYVDERNCSQNIFWLEISTYEKGLSAHTGKNIKLGVQIDSGSKVTIDVPLKFVYQPPAPFGKLMEIGLLSGFSASSSFVEALQRGDKVNFTIVGPSEISEKFDIESEVFSLSGFTAHHLKARAACKHGDSELGLTPSVSEEEIRQELVLDYEQRLASRTVRPRNLAKSNSPCDDPYSSENRETFEVFLSNHDDVFATKGPYAFLAEGSDGYDEYPSIKVVNICDLDNPLDVTEIIGTEAQVNQMYIDGERLYIVSNNASRVSYLDDDPSIVFQIINIESMEKIKLLGEYAFEASWPNFNIFEDRAYIADRDKLLVLDTSNPSKVKGLQSIKLEFQRKSGADEIAITEKYIFVTGDNVLKMLDRATYTLLDEATFDFRTSDVIVINDHVYVLGWKNNMKNSKIAVIDKSQGQLGNPSIITTPYRIRSVGMFDGHIIGNVQMVPDNYTTTFKILDELFKDAQ